MYRLAQYSGCSGSIRKAQMYRLAQNSEVVVQLETHRCTGYHSTVVAVAHVFN